MSDPLHHDEKTVRLQKLESLKKIGVKLYPDRFAGKQDIVDIRRAFDQGDNPILRSVEDIIPDSRSTIRTAGRVMLMRSFGKLIFGQLQDSTGMIQFCLSKEFSRLSQSGEEIESFRIETNPSL